MKNLKILIITLAAIGLSFLASSCVKNSELEGKVKSIIQLDSLSARMSALEARMKNFNTDISTLRTVVEALQKNLYVTEVEKTEDGFKLTFSDGSSVSVTNGKNGVDGKDAPVIGIKKEDGVYYWTLTYSGKTEWLLDDSGNKIRVTGPQGAAGKNGSEMCVTECGDTICWARITSEGDTIELRHKGKLVPAVGKDGDSFFSGIDTTKSGYVILTLASGTNIELPYKAELDKLVSRIQSIEVIPDYRDGSVDMKKKECEIKFEVRPTSLLCSIVEKKWKDAFSLQAIRTRTKALTNDSITVTSASVSDDSLLVLTVNGKSLPDEFFAGTQPFNARLRISDGNTDKTSAYFPLAPVPDVKVAVLLPNEEFTRWKNDSKYLLDTLKNAGYEAEVFFAKDNSETQVAQIKEAYKDGYNNLIVAAVDVSSLSEVLKTLSFKYVISHDRLIMESDKVDAVSTFDYYEIGKMQGQYIVDSLKASSKESATLEIFSGDPGDDIARYLFNGAMEVLKSIIGSGKISVPSGKTDFHETATLGWSSEEARLRMDNLLASEYSITRCPDFILCGNDNLAYGVINALNGTCKKPWSLITGMDAESKAIGYIKSKDMTMTIDKNYKDLAYMSATALIDLINGTKLPSTKTIDNGAKDVPMVSCTSTVIDRRNLPAN